MTGPIAVRVAANGRIGLAMSKSAAYVTLTRKQAIALAFKLLRATGW